ncbi:hypothetical protein ABW19_dt0209089 [Dactylella cylindrospora]|nr:hypothetical protein ABW19_dt0209089 [Dactylella cylindrospora]
MNSPCLLSPKTVFKNQLDKDIQAYKSSGARSGRAYESVSARLLFWADDDLKVVSEIEKLAGFFKESLQYDDVEQLVIPSKNSQLWLSHEISKFALEKGGRDNLLIVYYGGHGDRAVDQERQAVWAATKHLDSPLLNWYKIQPLLLESEGDVLIILDCCYAGQAARSRQSRWKVCLLLASCGMGMMVPGVGGKTKSFTDGLLSEMSHMLEQKGEISISGIHQKLQAKEAGLEQQPYISSLSEASIRDIILRPHTLAHGHRTNEIKGPASILVRLDLAEGALSGSKRENFLRWLTGAEKPEGVLPEVVKIMDNAQSVKSCGQEILRNDRGSERPAHKPLPAELRDDIESRIEELDKDFREIADKQNPQSRWDDTEKVFQNISRHGQATKSVIESAIPTLNMDSVHELARSREAEAAGISETLRMRLLVLKDTTNDGSTSVPLIYPRFISTDALNPRFRDGWYRSTKILCEFTSSDGEEPVSPIQAIQGAIPKRFRKMALLHMQEKPTTFRTLHGLGYTQRFAFSEPRDLGMVYEFPMENKDDEYLTLCRAIESCKCIPLERRMRAAYALSISILQMHAIGWLHKSIKSDNVLLFAQRSLSSTGSHIKLEDPYLIGFGSPRQRTDQSLGLNDFSLGRDLYRHPDRWGQPKVHSSLKHDIYAFGILLLEIGLWAHIVTLDDSWTTKTLHKVIADPEAVREKLQKFIDERLAHHAGTSYAKAVSLCLSDAPEFNCQGEESWRVLKFFRINVVDVLQSLCMQTDRSLHSLVVLQSQSQELENGGSVVNPPVPNNNRTTKRDKNRNKRRRKAGKKGRRKKQKH